MKGIVLLVEDQNPFLFQTLLEAYNGFQFIVAKRGDMAVILFKQHKPDLVLMDVRLPVLDGVESVRQIRKLDVTTPIIIMTAYETKDVRQRALAAGANYFFGKPFNYRRLYQKIVELVNQAPAQSELEHVETLISYKTKRLQKLREKQALLGVISVPPEILLEIEMLEIEIEELQQKRSRP